MKLTKSQLKEMIREEMKSLNETVPMGKMDKVKFMKYFDLMLKTAGTDRNAIAKVLKRFGFPSGRPADMTATWISELVKRMTGGGE